MQEEINKLKMATRALLIAALANVVALSSHVMNHATHKTPPPSVVVCNHPEQRALEDRVERIEEWPKGVLPTLSDYYRLDDRIKKLEAERHLPAPRRAKVTLEHVNHANLCSP